MGFLKWDRDNIISGYKDMQNMSGDSEYLKEEFIDFIIFEVLNEIGYEVPELRQAIVKKFPDYNNKDSISSLSDFWQVFDNIKCVKLLSKPCYYFDPNTEVYHPSGRRFSEEEWSEMLKLNELECLEGCEVLGLMDGEWVKEWCKFEEFEVEYGLPYKKIISED